MPSILLYVSFWFILPLIEMVPFESRRVSPFGIFWLTDKLSQKMSKDETSVAVNYLKVKK